MDRKIDVIIIGGGPAGLSAAIELKKHSVPSVLIIEREENTGGIPRHCGHYPFGMREYKRLLTGQQYAKKLTKEAKNSGVKILTSTSVVQANEHGKLLITSNEGLREISAARIIYATGVRETPRSARLISGSRPQGVLNTGALQAMVYLEAQKPFNRPVIIGSELVAFSAIQTCNHAKIKPVAIIEPSKNVTAQWPVELYAPFKKLPIYKKTKLTKIISNKDNNLVSAVEVENSKGEKRLIDCDGVILTGQFIPEASLARSGHLEIDINTNGPKIDQFGRCSDPVYFAAGNILRAVETSGWSWNEGKEIGKLVADDLAGKLPSYNNHAQIITKSELIEYVMPQKITLPFNPSFGYKNLQLRFSARAKGNLIVNIGKKEIYKKKLKVFPQKRVLIPLKIFKNISNTSEIEIKFEKV